MRTSIFTRQTSTSSDLQKNEKKSVFDRILMVNSVHKRWKTKTRMEKRNLDTDNIINNINIRKLATT